MTQRVVDIDAVVNRELKRLRTENTRLRRAKSTSESEVETLKAQVAGLRLRCRRLEQRSG